MPEAGHRLELIREVRPGGTPTALFLAHVLERGLEQVVTDGWATTARSLGALVPQADLYAAIEGREAGSTVSVSFAD